MMNAPNPRATAQPRAQYDGVAPGAAKKRRKVTIELAHETGKGSAQLTPYRRLMAIALVRDAQRNFSGAKSILHQLGMNVVGTEFKLRIKAEGAEEGQLWFNRVFARNCDFRSDRHLADLNRLLVLSVARDGDAGMLFDRDFMETGRLAFWESDQICNPDPLPSGIHASHDGMLVDRYGREVGYFVHNGYGKQVVKLNEGHVFPRDPLNEDANMFRLLRAPWRLNQARGVSDTLTAVTDLLDTYEMRAKELQSAKVAATFAGIVKKKNVEDGAALTDPSLMPSMLGEDDQQEEAQENEGQHAEQNYDRLEALTGGAMEYLDEEDEFELLDHNRPNVKSIEFVDHIVKAAGSAMGMARCYSTMEAQASYTAFRGEMIMTWVTFLWWQKWLERYIQDWQAIRAIRWAVDNGQVKAMPDGWEYKLAWTHPRMPSVNPLVDQQTFLAALRNGTTTLEAEVGPGWRDVIGQLATEIEEFGEKKIPHPLFQTVSGAEIEKGKENEDV